MQSFFIMLIPISSFIFSLAAFLSESEASCRRLEFRTTVNGKSLTNHTIRTIQPIKDVHTCRTQCYLEPLCFAVNFCQKNGSEAVCELLNNTATVIHDEDLVNKQECTFHNSESSCSSSPCPSNASCHGDFLTNPVPYKCICPAGSTGKFCESDIDECSLNTDDCPPNANCINLMNSYNCTCKTGYQGDGRNCKDIDECASNTHNCRMAFCNNTVGGFNCIYPTSCNEVLSLVPGRINGFYQIEAIPGQVQRTYCYYSSIAGCGTGPWVMALKIDGTKTTGEYSKPLWTDKRTINPDSFTNVFDDNSEIKLPAYWSHPVTRVCIGMKYSGALNWIAMNVSASNLLSLCTSQERTSNLGRNTWVSLLSSYTLDAYCNKEGFNARCGSRKARIGLLTNNEKHECFTCDSFIGFGGITFGSLSCGNVRFGSKKKAFCYVLIQ